MGAREVWGADACGKERKAFEKGPARLNIENKKTVRAEGWKRGVSNSNGIR